MTKIKQRGTKRCDSLSLEAVFKETHVSVRFYRTRV